MQERVSLVRRLLANAMPDLRADSLRGRPLRPSIDPGRLHARRALARREINRIADRWGWQDEIQHALDQAGQPGLKHLDPDQLETLVDHLHRLVDCMQTASDPHDAPPAR